MIGMERWIDPRVGQVKPSDVMHYLVSHGWKRQPFPRQEVLVFEGPPDDSGKPIIQMLPASEGAPDYRGSLIRLITALAIIEDRMAPAVLDDILQPTIDMARSASRVTP
jgi:hypothetical protein